MGKYCIGIDLGGSFVKFCLLDEKLSPSETIQLPTKLDRKLDGIVATMSAGVDQLLGLHGLLPGDIVGVGMGAPGPMSMSRGVIFAMPNLPGIVNVPIRDAVSVALGLPVAIENDANAAAYGEHIRGAGGKAGDMVLLTLGTGVGSGIIIDGKILHGSHEMGAEIGHMIIEPDGEPCGCGQRGCLERYCSASYIGRLAQRLIESDGRTSSLAGVISQKGSIDARDILEAARSGDKLAAEAWDRGAYYLALGCVNICRIFDPEMIVLAGGMTKAGDSLLDPVRGHFRRLHWTITEPATKIIISALGGDAGAIGAAGVAWKEFGGK